MRDLEIILGRMFLEIIQALSNLISGAFKDMVLKGRDQGPLLLPEEAVRRAVHPSLGESVKAALDSTHKSMNKLFTLICVK